MNANTEQQVLFELTEEEEEKKKKKKKKKRCHGNRQDQRFRKKWRARNMNPYKIEKLLAQRKQTHRSNIQQATTTTATTIPRTNTKRKFPASSQSISSISMGQPISKKIKKSKSRKDPIITKSVTMNTLNESRDLISMHHYRQPMYLNRSSYMLFKILQKTFKQPIKIKSEQKFLYLRLNLLDQHYFLAAHLHLWESYLRIGLDHERHRWPEELYQMAETHDFELCKQYLLTYIEDIRMQMNSLESRLIEQVDVCPITSMSMEQIDCHLKEFVQCQRKYLLSRNIRCVEKFQVNIQRDQSLEAISTYYPTIDQNEYIDRLIDLRKRQIKIWELQLMLEIQVLCRFLPLLYNDLQTFLLPHDYLPINNEQVMIRTNNLHYRSVQETKRRFVHQYLSLYEDQLRHLEEEYQETLVNMKSTLIKNTSLQGQVLFNQISAYMIHQTKLFKEQIIKQMSAFRGRLIRNRQRSSSAKTTMMINLQPQPYLDLLSHPFDHREMHYLSLGPACIRMNQSAIRSETCQQIEIKHTHEDILLKVQNHLVEWYHIPRTFGIFRDYSNHLYDSLSRVYTAPLSYKDHVQAKEQAQIIASIRAKLERNQLIIHVTDKSNNFYIGSKIEFEKKVQKYFMETNAYIELHENPFDDVLHKVVQLLNQLRGKKSILQWQYNQMMPDPKKTELSHLYFNPKTHKDDIPVRPIMNTIRAATTKISKFLDQIIRPIFDSKCRTTTIIDGASLLADLRNYQQRGLLKPTTLFCTLDIHNLYTMLPQEESFNVLIEFLYAHGYRKVKGVPLDAIKKLATIVIKENVFVYQQTFHRQVIGGAMGSSFTLTLANIFLWKWQKELVRIQDVTGEYFGRYIDDIFMTWNRSERELKQLLNQANQWHPNIKLDYTISGHLPFLDVLLTNRAGYLSTSVYHRPTTEPYVVPYVSDHHPHVFRNIIRTFLQRAIRYSSSYKLFDDERRSIKLMLLYNGYPSSFIDEQFERFFAASTETASFVPYIYNEEQFLSIHRKINGQLTPRQSQVAQSAAVADLDNEQTDEHATTTTAARTTVTKNVPMYENKLITHYTHEKRFRSVKSDLHQVYDAIFWNTPAAAVKLIVGNRNRRDARHELIRKKPKLSLLQNQAREIKRKYATISERRRQATARP